MAAQFTVTQTRTDSMTVTSFGPVALLEFTAAGDDTPSTRTLVSAAGLAEALAAPEPLTAAAELPPHVVLTDAGAARLAAEGVSFLFDGSTSGNLVLGWEQPTEELVAALEAFSELELAERTFELDFSSHGLWRLDAEDSDGPVHAPVLFEVSGALFDVDAAEAHLRALPKVISVRRREGRSGFDPTPATLDVVANVSAEVWSAMCAHTAVQYSWPEGAQRRPPAPSIAMATQILTWYLAHGDAPAGDPFGLAEFLRNDDYDSFDE